MAEEREHVKSDLSQEELDQQTAEELPDREAMTLIRPDPQPYPFTITDPPDQFATIQPIE